MEDLTHQADSRNEMLRERSQRCVCKYCGGKLRLRQLTFSDYEGARTEVFCGNCDRIEFGVEPEIYETARYFVEETGVNYFPDLDDTAQTKRMNVAEVCKIMEWQAKSFGYLNDNGFEVAPRKLPFQSECIHVTDADLDEIAGATQSEGDDADDASRAE